jgi:extracellular elastinolytic metalloproteinase
MTDHEKNIPEDYHAMYDAGARRLRRTLAAAAPVEAEAAQRRLAQSIQSLAVEHDQATQLPNLIASRTPGVALNQPSAVEPDVAVTRFIKDQRELWGLSEEDAAAVEVVAVSRKGLRSVRLIQRLDGMEVFNSDVTVGIDQHGAVLSVSGQFFPGVARSPARSARQGGITEEAAIAKAASDLSGHAYGADEFARLPAPPNSGPYRFYEHKPAADDPRPRFERPVRVKDVLFPVGGEQFVRGYYLELWLKDWPAFSYVIDTVDEPDLLFRRNLTSSIAFRYRVHNTGDALFRPEDGPAPGSPHPTGQPDGFQAATIEEKLIEIESLLPGDPWLPPGATETRGNNCIAYADLRAPDGISQGDVMGAITEPGVFGHRYDHTKPASDPQNLQNSLVGMFFHVNWLHDRWYEAGFDEGSGCAQQDNFGRGGLGGDPILAEGNDFSGKNNANMATPPEGSSPRMQMFEFTGTNPTRTSNHEALITFHEMGHYITNRLVGNASGLINRQGRAMGEGWGDFFAICMTSQPGDDFAHGAFAVGGWTDETPTFKDNYYFSIRRYPYSADMAAKNPLSFRHISANVVLPAGPPRNPLSGGSNAEVHNAGEIWCCALWEAFVNLVAKHGHTEAEDRMLKYVVGGLKLTPNSPTFTQARDAIIIAVSALHPEDLSEVWAGFAKRGMGVGAVAPPAGSTTLTGVVESFETPAGPLVA